MKILSVNISPRVQCGKTAGKTRVSVTQLNSKLHCREFVSMCGVMGPTAQPKAHLVIMSLHTLMESTGPAAENFSNSIASVTCSGGARGPGARGCQGADGQVLPGGRGPGAARADLGGEVAHVERGLGVGGG